MKTLKLTFLSFAVAMFAASCGSSDTATEATVTEEVAPAAEETASATELPVNTETSVVKWKGAKVTKSHNGTLKLSEGTVTVEAGELKGGSFTIDMTTLENEDLAGTDMYEKLIGHLKSPDFFNVDSFPTATFVITSVEPSTEEGATHKVAGNMTIKGITKNLSFPATVSTSETGLKSTAAFSFDRSEFDVRFGSKTFFPDKLADELIKNDIELEVVLVAGE